MYNKRDHYWNTINTVLKKEFGAKGVKLSLNGGFTCPNRDGHIGIEGCTFCGADGAGSFSGDPALSITEQIEEQKKHINSKWSDGLYIAYFQNFTGTYGAVEHLKTLYEEALNAERVVGIAIATRPDCISDSVLELLSELNNKTFLWIELGVQTIHDFTAEKINRGYPFAVFLETYEKLRRKNIKTVVHLINGLPGESIDMMLESAYKIGALNPWGLKIHLLHVMEGTVVAKEYLEGLYKPLDRTVYINLVVKQLECIPWGVTIHRLTGDGDRFKLLAPRWSTDKKTVLNDIRKAFVRRGSFQGSKIE